MWQLCFSNVRCRSGIVLTFADDYQIILYARRQDVPLPQRRAPPPEKNWVIYVRLYAHYTVRYNLADEILLVQTITGKVDSEPLRKRQCLRPRVNCVSYSGGWTIGHGAPAIDFLLSGGFNGRSGGVGHPYLIKFVSISRLFPYKRHILRRVHLR